MNDRQSIRGKTWIAPVSLAGTETGPEHVLTQILSARKIEDHDAYLRPTFKGVMPDPYIFTDMQAAVELMCDSIQAGRNIVLLGDYDVDGATSTAIVGRFLKMLNHSNWRFYIPDRLTEGYGPNEIAIRKLRDEGGEVLVVLDSGTAAIHEMNVAADVGFQTIIIDHHKAQHALPTGLLVNPQRDLGREGGNYTYLCTAGLAFLFCIALHRELKRRGQVGEDFPSLKQLLGPVALGTVADVVPLLDLNRALVALGLPHMGSNIGISALIEATGHNDPSSFACGFVFGPCINAAGRIDDTSLGAKLLLSDDPNEAKELAERLVSLNSERQDLQKAAVAQARQDADQMTGSRALVLYNEDWHPGIVGLVASRIKEAADKPAIVIGADRKGSARSIEGFDIGEAIIEAAHKGLLVKGGGHAMAAGLTLAPGRIEEFRAFMDAAMEGVPPAPLRADLDLPADALSFSLIDHLKRLEPIGAGNPGARFILRGAKIRSAKVMKDLHAKCEVDSSKARIEILAFNCMGTPLGERLANAGGSEIDVIGSVKINEWNGRRTINIHPDDIAV